MKKQFFTTLFALSFAVAVNAQTVISPKDASKHIGETVSLTGKVFGGKLIASNNMTLIDIGGYNPNQDLTLVIGSADRSKFKGKPEEDLKGKDVKVTGKLIDYKGKPEIILTEPEQLRVVLSDNIVPIPADKH